MTAGRMQRICVLMLPLVITMIEERKPRIAICDARMGNGYRKFF
jgi:hypothetical protein